MKLKNTQYQTLNLRKVEQINSDTLVTELIGSSVNHICKLIKVFYKRNKELHIYDKCSEDKTFTISHSQMIFIINLMNVKIRNSNLVKTLMYLMMTLGQSKLLTRRNSCVSSHNPCQGYDKKHSMICSSVRCKVLRIFEN